MGRTPVGLTTSWPPRLDPSVAPCSTRHSLTGYSASSGLLMGLHFAMNRLWRRNPKVRPTSGEHLSRPVGPHAVPPVVLRQRPFSMEGTARPLSDPSPSATPPAVSNRGYYADQACLDPGNQGFVPLSKCGRPLRVAPLQLETSRGGHFRMEECVSLAFGDLSRRTFPWARTAQCLPPRGGKR